MGNYVVRGSQVFQDGTQEIITNGFPAGTYTVEYDGNTDTAIVEPFTVNADSIIELPDPAFKGLVQEVNTFFKPETRDKFKEYGFVYKKSILLHGRPGTGKTCLIVKLLQTFSETFDTGMVLFNPDLRGLAKVVSIVPATTPILVLFEEFDNIFSMYRESHVLSLLDGEIQRPNTFYLFTTNFIDKVPKRLLRPGRISNIIEVLNPSLEARIVYLQAKMPNVPISDIQSWAHQTDGMSVDDLKHSVLCVQCLGLPLEQTIKNIHAAQKHMEGYAVQWDEDDDDDDDGIRQALKNIATHLKNN